MAKGKHAAALFEVIHANKQTGSKASLLRTPKWWFKGRQKDKPQSNPVPPAASGPIEGTTIIPVDPTAVHATPVEVKAKTALRFKLEPDRKLINFKVSYTSAIVTAFTILVVVGLSYIIGSRMTRGPSPAMAGPSTEQVRQGPARPDVLNIASNGTSGAGRVVERDPDDAIASSTGQPSANNPRPSQQPTPQVATPGKRTVNLNYIIIQSYPDQISATEAVRALADSGVPATIEKGLRGYGSTWHTVVGMQGFSRARGPEYDAYMKQLQQISDKFARSRKSFKAFQPLPYKWDRP